MEFYEDDLELYKHVNFEDSMQVLFFYLIFLFIIKYYFRF
jgi:hypothetical protein